MAYPQILLSKALIFLTLSWGMISISADEFMKSQDYEKKYKKLTAQEEISISEHYKIGEWCRKVASYLPVGQRRVFQERSRDHIFKAEGKAREGLISTFKKAQTQIHQSTDYLEAQEIIQRAKAEGELYLENLFVTAGSHIDKTQFSDQFFQLLQGLNRKTDPLRVKYEAERLENGKVLFLGEWIDAETPLEDVDFLGRIPLSKLRKESDRYVGKTVVTDLITTGKTYELLELWLLDGFDDRGQYLIPNFMPGRLVFHLVGSNDWKEKLQKLRPPPAKDKSQQKSNPDEKLYRFQIVAQIAAAHRQYCHHFQASIQQVAIFDEKGKRIEFLAPETETQR